MEGNHRDVGCYAHTWLFDKDDSELISAALLEEPESGREMEVLTTEPGILLYTGDGLDGSITGKNGKVYSQWGGLCLETQSMPDAPNHINFPSAVFNPGEVYGSTTKYSFKS